MPDASSNMTKTFSPGWHGRPSTQSIVALAGMWLAAMVGAILNWPWWLEYALIAPLAVWLIVSERLVVYQQVKPGSDSSDRGVPVVLVVLVLFAAAIEPTRFSGLVVTAAFAVLLIFGRRRRNHAPATTRTTSTHGG
jgi:hypothetical protein